MDIVIDLATPQPLGSWRRLFYAGPSADVLYEDDAWRGRIDDRAPIAARGAVLTTHRSNGSGDTSVRERSRKSAAARRRSGETWRAATPDTGRPDGIERR